MPRLVVGLGNPGREYEKTRHNVGFWVLDELAKDLGIAVGRKNFTAMVGDGLAHGEKFTLLKPQTYMNRSGEAVAAAVRFFGLEPAALLVICDDLDLPTGRLRLRPAGGAGGHRGLTSIIQHLGSTDFPRLRVGIGRPEEKAEVVDYVLGRVGGDEAPALQEAVKRAAGAARLWLEEGLEAAMNRYNV
ncbi:MAG: aminoacyl-tRNA hydrolase [Symbiobacteriia bacterium]